MKAAVITQFGGPEVFRIENRSTPVPKPFEVLIEVKAAGINRPDVFQRKGNYPAPAEVDASIPGLEVSGVVVALGNEVQKFQLGDEVMALIAGGGYATMVCAAEVCCIQKPANLSFIEAAALPENVYTVWNNLFQRGQLVAGESVLIHGGAGGIGTIAIQLAKQFGARVYTTVGSPEKMELVRSLGADDILDYKKDDFEIAWKSNKIDVVLDSIAGEYFNKHINILNEDGRLIHINAVEGGKVALNLFKMMQKRILITGSTLRSRDLQFKALLTRAIELEVIPLILENKIKPIIREIFALEDVVEAHFSFEKAEHYGKIVLTNIS